MNHNLQNIGARWAMGSFLALTLQASRALAQDPAANEGDKAPTSSEAGPGAVEQRIPAAPERAAEQAEPSPASSAPVDRPPPPTGILPAAPQEASVEPTPAAETKDEAEAGLPAVVDITLPARNQPVDSESRWYEKLKLGLFADSYLGFNFNRVKPEDTRNRFRAFDTSNGFALSWVGLDARYDREVVAATLNLRFGPSAQRLVGNKEAALALDLVKQAYATLRPSERWSFDFGKFDAMYGVERLDSQLNFNYTLGILRWFGQPRYHVGLRAQYKLSDALLLTALASNGWNRGVDNNAGKSVGLKLDYREARRHGSGDVFRASLGYLVGPEQEDYVLVTCPPGTFSSASNSCDSTAAGAETFPLSRGSSNIDGLKHFVDVVVAIEPVEHLSLVANADFGIEHQRRSTNVDVSTSYDSVKWWGLSGHGRYEFAPWALAVRGEVYADINGASGPALEDVSLAGLDLLLYSATLTLELEPFRELTLKLDNRLDMANSALFYEELRSMAKSQFTTTLGVVVQTN